MILASRGMVQKSVSSYDDDEVEGSSNSSEDEYSREDLQVNMPISKTWRDKKRVESNEGADVLVLHS